MAHFGLRVGCWQRDCSATLNGGPPELDHSNKGTGSSIRVDALCSRCTTGFRMFPPRFGYHRRAIHRGAQRGREGSRFKRSARKWPLGFSTRYFDSITLVQRRKRDGPFTRYSFAPLNLGTRSSWCRWVLALKQDFASCLDSRTPDLDNNIRHIERECGAVLDKGSNKT